MCDQLLYLKHLDFYSRHNETKINLIIKFKTVECSICTTSQLSSRSICLLEMNVTEQAGSSSNGVTCTFGVPDSILSLTTGYFCRSISYSSSRTPGKCRNSMFT